MNNTLMTINGLSCTLHMPQALKSKLVEGKEIAQHLPPYAPRPAYVVDEYNCPPDWMHGSARAASYFVPVLEDHGLWFDFNMNSNHSHDIAAVVSIQKINPLTGQAIDQLRLEQYRENCPIHNKPFGHQLFCEECGYQWPGQNYISTTSQPRGYFWIDGCRNENGVVRQYILTKEKCKGIAAQIIGEERVFAIGIAFFLSKEPKPAPPMVNYSNPFIQLQKQYLDFSSDEDFWIPTTDFSYQPKHKVWTAKQPQLSAQHTNSRKRSSNIRLRDTNDFIDLGTPVKLEIGAGAKINQEFKNDEKPLGYWEETPYLLYINYIDEKSCNKILEAGKKDLTKGGEGFLAGLRKGN